MGDLFDSLRFRGFQKLAMKHVAFGIKEMVRSAFISLSLKELQKYIPEVQSSDITRYTPFLLFSDDKNFSIANAILFYFAEDQLGSVLKHLTPMEVWWKILFSTTEWVKSVVT